MRGRATQQHHHVNMKLYYNSLNIPTSPRAISRLDIQVLLFVVTYSMNSWECCFMIEYQSQTVSSDIINEHHNLRYVNIKYARYIIFWTHRHHFLKLQLGLNLLPEWLYEKFGIESKITHIIIIFSTQVDAIPLPAITCWCNVTGKTSIVMQSCDDILVIQMVLLIIVVQYV